MKKFYFLLTLVLAVMCTVSVNAQKYRLSEEAKFPEAGVTYAIMNAGANTYMSCKYGPSGGLLDVLADEDVLWQIEATGEKTEAGFDLYYLYSVGQQKYVQEVDLENNDGLDGYDVFAYNGFNFELGDKTNALKVTIEKGSSGEDALEGEVWRTNGPSTGFVIARQNICYWTNSEGNKDAKCMKFGRQNVNVAFEPYNEDVAWQFWTVEKLGAKEELEQLVDNYSGTEFVAGTDPGFYNEAKVAAYNESLETAMLLVMTTATEEEYANAVADLRAKREAVENGSNPLAPGYYYMVSAFDAHLDEFGVEKAAYGNASTNTLFYRTFDADNVDFVFYIEEGPDPDEFWVQDYSTSLFVSKGTAWYNSTPFMTPDKAEPQNIRLFTSGKWYWGSREFHNTSYTPYAQSYPVSPKDGEGALTSWGQWADDCTKLQGSNLWYVRSVPADKMADFAKQKAQADRDTAVKLLVKEANTLYAKLFSYTPNFDTPLITRASGGNAEEPAEDNQVTFSTIRGQGIATADKYEFLIDEDPTTYMQGSGYLRIKLDEPKQILTFVYQTRGGSDKQKGWGLNERPKLVNIYGANTLEGDTVFGPAILQGLDMSAIDENDTETLKSIPVTVNLGRPVNRIAYQVDLNNNGGTYFTLGGFQIYEATVDESTSQYYTTEGLSTLAETMKSLAAEKAAIAAENASTEADYAELLAAVEAVQNQYADPDALAALIAECTTLATTVKVGEGIGESNDENAGPTLEAAVEKASKVEPSAPVAEIKAAISELQAAKEAFMATIKQFETGKFYYFVSASEAEKAGAAMYTALPKTTLTSATNAVLADVTGEDYTTSANHMYCLVQAPNGNYYIQNLATGFYLPNFATADAAVNASRTPVEFKVEYKGNGAFAFVSSSALNSEKCGLGVMEDNTIAFVLPSNETTLWTIVEPEEVEAIVTKRYSYNTYGVMALPYELSTMDVNENFKMYGIKKITQEEDPTGELVSTIEFYEKETAAANEPVFYVWGDSEAEAEEAELLAAMPSSVTNTMAPANGIVGTLYSQAMGSGVAYFTGNETKVTTTSTNIFYQLGVIDPTYYTGEVDGVETAYTMTITGLNKIPSASGADVNGDGQVNAADVVSVYNFIIQGEESGVTEKAADVNGDKTVNAADVVAIYNEIIGAAGSRRFRK